MHDLIADGNSVLLVDHDTQILKEADWLIEMGPQAGGGGGMVIAQGTIEDIKNNESSQIGPFLSGKGWMYTGNKGSLDEMFSGGKIHL